MRPRYQDGSIQRRGNQWVLRFWEDRKGSRVRTVKPIASYDAHPYRTPLSSTDEKLLRKELETRIDALLDPVNQGRGSTGNVPLGEFIENSYFSRLDLRLKIPAGNELHIEPSTIKGYKDIYNAHVKKAPAAKIPLRDFTPQIAQKFMESLPQETLSHQTHLRIKNFLSGVFTWAIADGALSGTNPMDATKAGGQTKKVKATTERKVKIQASHDHAYTLEEVAEMLDKLPEPARTVCAVAAFTGLSRSELRGLQWQDYDGETIKVQRKIWRDYVGPTKTEAREAGVPVISLLVKILTKYKKSFPPAGDGWIFRGEKLLNPLDLDNLSRRDIPQFINGAWFGWHAFRRGLGTRLNEASVDSETIQRILRHSDISTTQAYYIIPDQKRAAAGLKKLDRIMRTKYGIKS
jgi:integrase